MSATVIQFKARLPAFEDGWQIFARWCVRNPERLKPSEIPFVASMATWPRPATEKQLNWLDQIRFRYEKAEQPLQPAKPRKRSAQVLRFDDGPSAA